MDMFDHILSSRNIMKDKLRQVVQKSKKNIIFNDNDISFLLAIITIASGFLNKIYVFIIVGFLILFLPKAEEAIKTRKINFYLILETILLIIILTMSVYGITNILI